MTRQLRQQAAALAFNAGIARSAKRRMAAMEVALADLPVAEVLQAYRATGLRPMVGNTLEDGCACPLTAWAIWKGYVKSGDYISIDDVTNRLAHSFGDDYLNGIIAGVDGKISLSWWSERRTAGYLRGCEIAAAIKSIEVEASS